MFFRYEIIVSGILPRGRDLYRVEKGVAIQAPLLNRKAGYINERLRYIASSLPRLTYTPHPRFVVDSVIQRSLLCKDGLHFSSRGSVQVVADLEKAISTVRASLHAAQKRPVVSRPATPRPVVTPSEDTKTVSFSYRDALLTTFQILQPVSVPLFNIDNFPALSPVSYASNILSLFTARPTVVSVTGSTRPTVVSVTGPPRSAAVSVTGSTRPTVVSVTGPPRSAAVSVTGSTRPTVVSVTGPPRSAAVSVTGSTRPTVVSVTGPPRSAAASPSIKPSAAKKIRFEHLPSLGDSEQHSVQTENFTTVNDFNFTALPSSPTPVTYSATPSRPTPPQSVPVSIPSVPSPSLPSSSSPVRQSPIHRGRLWQEFNGHELTFKEKTDIKFDKKLCCQTMNFCQSVTKSQFPCITGFQNTWRVPVLENKKWIYQHKMRSQPSPSVQIHHTGCDHWITSCQDPNGTIYVLDSMNGKTLTTSVQIQMSMIYGKGKTVVPVKIPNVQQQKNSIDCGVFAIVFMVEFCFNNFIGRDNVNFDTYTMRDHLIKCIESQQFSPFPKTKPTRTKVLSLKNTSVNFSIEKECTARCNLPNLFEDMVCCDRCSAWYHYGCVLSNISNTFSGSLSFTCSNCSSTP